MFSSPSPVWVFESWQRKKPGKPLLYRRWMFLAVLEVTRQLRGSHSFHFTHWKDFPGELPRHPEFLWPLQKQHSGHSLKAWLAFMQHSQKNKMHLTPSPNTHPQIFQFSLLIYYIVICNNSHLSKNISKFSFLHFKTLAIQSMVCGPTSASASVGAS